jgi:hypothetical protein
MVVAEPEPESVVRAAAAVHAQPDRSATLAEIVCQAQRCLPEFEHVSVSRIRHDGSLETLVAGTDLARSFDAVQSSARQGPCIEATDEDLVVVRDARHEQRWPDYIGQATKLGLLSQIGVRLRSDAHGVICLNLHSTTHADIDAGSVGVAEHFAVHAGLALGHVLKEEQLSTAIGTRTVIGTAVGIMMERYGMTQAAAFSFLVRQASTENRKVRVIASEVVGEVEEAARDGRGRRIEAVDGNLVAPPATATPQP